jgi:hypothetical protein
MGRGRKHFKVIQPDTPGLDQEELMNMFQQLTGDPNKLDPEIVQDKYDRLKHSIQRCNKLMRKFKEAILDRLTTKIGNDPLFDSQVRNLVDYLDRADAYIDEQVDSTNLIPIYQVLKESFVIEEYLKVCKALRAGEDCIKDRTNLSDTFIKRAVGDDLVIFDFCRINFKHLFSHILAENIPDKKELSDAKTYILLTFNMLYITTQDIYSIVSSPDVDIDKLSELIVQAIGAAKKQIPRCDKAFRLIENSVDLLKNGMSGYYKDFVASGNPTVIFENFINDLSGDLHIDTQTMGQFKRIIFHFRKRAENIPQANAKLNGVFSTLDKIMSMMEDKPSKQDSKASAESNDNSESDDDVETVQADK